MKRKASLKDIAQAVGVSTALVSYVVNNKEKEARVGKEIAEKIREVAKQLDYQPNQIAKSLKSGMSQTLGLIVADIANPFFGGIARTIEDEAQKHNYTVIFGSFDENVEKSWNVINVLIKKQVDGFIIAPAENSESQIEYLNDQKIPFVLIDRYFPSIPSSYVVTDNYQASYNAVTHLIKTGHKKIAMLAYNSNLVHMKERKRGYRDALIDAGLDADPSFLKEVSFADLKNDVDKVMNELFADGCSVDGLFFATNTLSVNGLKFLNRSNCRIPDDVAVVCFDEGDAFEFFYSPLTFVDQPVVEVGKEAVRILIDQISNNDNSRRQITISSKLVVRESSGAK